MAMYTQVIVIIKSLDQCYYNFISTAYRHGVRAGIGEIFEKHLGPVTGISAHSNQSLPDFNHLFLTSSIDWSIKLWSLKVKIQNFIDLILMTKIKGQQTSVVFRRQFRLCYGCCVVTSPSGSVCGC